MKKKVIYPIAKRPSKKDPEGDGWSVEIILISGKTERRGYYDPKGSVAGEKFFYFRKQSIIDCAHLKNYPTHWYYA